MASIDRPKVKVLAVGDSGVGKTSFVHLVCTGETIISPSSTIGCSVDVAVHDYKAGTAAERQFFVELWDVGGSSSHTNSRPIFYQHINGIILLHDLTNRKSQLNLEKWIGEVVKTTRDAGGDQDGTFDPEQFVGSQVPLLVVGTKADAAERVRGGQLMRSRVAEEYGADEVNLDGTNVKSLAPGSSNAVKLSRFFDKVIERRYYSSQVPTSSVQLGGMAERRRPPYYPSKVLTHMD